MAHNLSWIDPEDLRALVLETAYRRPSAELPRAPAPSSGGFVDAPASPPKTQQVPVAQPQRPSPSVRRASRPSLPNPDAPTLPAAPPVRASVVEPFSPRPGDGLEARLEQLMAWACNITGLARGFVADEEGLLVASLNAGANAVDDAASIVDMCARSVPADVGRADAGRVTMTASERTHVVAWDLTRHGKTYLALSGTVEPTPEALSTLSRALRDALR
ncbi:MAG: hypothetical protein ACE37F_10285 [Nannocystaceae bacterium]|nr:hypothetical protein [bacterium]